MKVSVIIVNYNVQYFLEVCLHSVLRACKGIDSEVIVVDNASKDGSIAMVRKKFPEVVLMANSENTGFSKANNQAFAIAQGEYVLILNPDTVLPENFFRETLAYLDAHPDVASLGPRLIDGKGVFAPDGKKSFPSLSVALFKTTGINKLFKRSPYFNKYYAVHIGERETADVEVLSGCCMMLRKADVVQAGGAFDEAFFMYCEDVDLSYRLKKIGKRNIYYPEVDVIHYKGESTRKATLTYVRIFNDALITFVRKHYTATHASLFVLFIKIGIAIRAVWSVVKNIVNALRMPLFDALALLLLLWLMHQFWVVGIKNIPPQKPQVLLATIPVYIFIWLLSMYLNGAYDRPYRALRIARGMIIGTVLNLAYFGLLSASYRYSRGVVVFTGLSGAIGLVILHELMYWLGIFRYIRYDELPKKAVIVGDEQHYHETAKVLRKVHYAPQLAGRVGISSNDKNNTLGSIEHLNALCKALSINEVIFCVNGLSYSTILHQMQLCGAQYDYKIHLVGATSFVGSNSSHTAGDLYTIDRRFKLSDFAQQRNKRVFDIVASFTLLLLSPIIVWSVKRKAGFYANLMKVLLGKKTWIGYSSHSSYKHGQPLPILRKGVLPTYVLQDHFVPDEAIKRRQDYYYAEHYAPGHDLHWLLKNRRYLGNYPHAS